MKTAAPGLEKLGWDEGFEAAFLALGERRGEAARVILEHQHIYRVVTASDEVAATVAGRLRHNAAGRLDYPGVGDWVSILRKPDARTVIQDVLPRRSRFLRKVAGSETAAQVIAANIDIVFVVAGLDHDFNERRIERYLVTAWEGGATPVVVLNKADVGTDVAGRVAHLSSVAPNLPIHAVSCRTGQGMDELSEHIVPGKTAALLGSSGVGKSSIINFLLGFDRQRTNDVRVSDGRGRHTTTNRELVLLPSGGLLIDTPGMRELQLWNVGDAMGEAFDDIHHAGLTCHYRNCRHDTEPRCAVKAAAEAGLITRERLDNYVRLQGELRHLLAKQDERDILDTKRREARAQRSRPRGSGNLGEA